MAETGQSLVGLEAVSRDGSRLGKIKSIVGDEQSSQYLVIHRFLAHDLIVPMAVIESESGHVRVPFASSFLDSAPRVDAKTGLSEEDRKRLDDFFRARAA